MYSAPWSIRAVALLILSNLSGTVAFPQSVNFIHHGTDPLPLVNLPLGKATCTPDSGSAAAPDAAATAAIDESTPCDTPPVTLPSVNPCNSASRAQNGCEAPRDVVQEELAAMGKTGQKILRARDRVLEILQTENACSAWLRQKDANAAATFRTLNYAVDRHGEEFVHISKESSTQYTYRDPYVATVRQDTGEHSTITLNAGGAFFKAQAGSLIVARERELGRIGNTRSVSIGPYVGDSLSAQTLALLHEFGHVINLLPIDFDNADGKSVQNTAEVLRFCRAEIDAKGRRGSRQSAR
jgi:hypothetical protein